jgi:hypothetical protein
MLGSHTNRVDQHFIPPRCRQEVDMSTARRPVALITEEDGLAKMAEMIAKDQSTRPAEPPMERAIEVLWREIAEVERARQSSIR